MGMIETLQGLGMFGKGRISVLDIGSSNLYSASTEAVRKLWTSYGVASSPETDVFADRLARGSAYDSVTGGTNGAFVGELLAKAGLTYHAIDIADGYGTTILDLNHESAPPAFVGAFDLVLNFGTTEHLLNQYNAFKVMHDATKVGGYIVHSLPCVGYSNHGYFTYTPRCMFDLAGYNEYEVVGFWFEGPAGSNDLFAPVRDYSSYFPNLKKTLADREQTDSGRKIGELYLPDVALMIIYRKVKQRPFLGALERSTSVGKVPSAVTSTYEATIGRILPRNAGVIDQKQHGATIRFLWVPSWVRTIARKVRALARGHTANGQSGQVKTTVASPPGSRVGQHPEISLSGQAAELRVKFVNGSLSYDESMAFYHLVVAQHGSFPYDWEYEILLMALQREPGRRDLAERLEVVRGSL